MTNIYAKDVSNIKVLDPYRLQELYQMHPCAEHVVKKLLVAGEREGGKDLDTDISDCIRTLTRWQAMRAEDAASATVSPGIDATHSESFDREFVSRYDWDTLSKRFGWVARNQDGKAFAFSGKPTRDSKEWKPLAGSYERYRAGDAPACSGDGWILSLEARPQ